MTSRAPRFPTALRPPSARTAETATLRPQRPLHDAAEDARRHRVPSGLGLDSQGVRDRMVARLRAEGLRCEPVLNAFAAVPRHVFVDSALATQAYEDTSLPIGWGQTISKPSVVGHMLALLFEGRSAAAAQSLGRVLEIGTGCGYQASLLSLLAARVCSVERLKPLHDKARAHVAALRLHNVRLVYGDGLLGHRPHAPYDSIVAAAGGAELPQAWLDQLSVGGRLVAPTERPSGGQVLCIVDRLEDGWRRRELDAVHFVPLKSGVA